MVESGPSLGEDVKQEAGRFKEYVFVIYEEFAKQAQVLAVGLFHVSNFESLIPSRCDSPWPLPHRLPISRELRADRFCDLGVPRPGMFSELVSAICSDETQGDDGLTRCKA